MDRSTPINHLQRNGNEQHPDEIIDNIVDDLEDEYQSDQRALPQQHFQQPPQQHYQQPSQQGGPFPGHQGPMMHPQMQQQMQQQMHHQPQPQQPSLANIPVSQKILGEAKEPLLVSVLVIIMSSPQLQSLIARFLPIAASNPLIGLGVRALFAGILFWLLRRFIPV